MLLKMLQANVAGLTAYIYMQDTGVLVYILCFMQDTGVLVYILCFMQDAASL